VRAGPGGAGGGRRQCAEMWPRAAPPPRRARAQTVTSEKAAQVHPRSPRAAPRAPGDARDRGTGPRGSGGRTSAVESPAPVSRERAPCACRVDAMVRAGFEARQRCGGESVFSWGENRKCFQENESLHPRASLWDHARRPPRQLPLGLGRGTHPRHRLKSRGRGK